MIKAPLSIEIVSDVACPWCFIGLRRLQRAIELVQAEITDFNYQLNWRPFFLNPDLPPEGKPYHSFLIQKFGSKERVDAIFRRIREVGASLGIDYRFDKIQIRANTLQAHRLIHWAQQQDDALRLAERLFIGQFQLGENIGDTAVLANMAAECGYDRQDVLGYLLSDKDAPLVQILEEEGRRWGITAVPTFIMARKVAIQGAEDPSILADAIRQAL